MYENSEETVELISVFPYKDCGDWYFELTYQFTNKKTGEVKQLMLPKVVNPFKESSKVKVEYIGVGIMSYAKLITPHHEHTLRLGSISKFMDKDMKDCYYATKIIKPAKKPTREMTVEEIEQELGYPVKVVKGEKKK